MSAKQSLVVALGLALIGLHYWFSQQRSTLGPVVAGKGRGVYGPMPTAVSAPGTISTGEVVANQATSAAGTTQAAASAAAARAPWSIGPVTIPFTGGG